MSNLNIVKSGKEDYGGQICECCKCHTVRKCTFTFDYYPIGVDGETLLQCERCLLKEHFGIQTPPMITIHPDGKVEIKENEDLSLN